jgi:hypothetical protein
VLPLRTLSGVERLWTVAESLAPPFANQIVFEAKDGLDLSLARLQATLDALEEHVPLLTSHRRGAGRRTRWFSGGARARVALVDGRNWDGRSEVGAPFLRAMPGNKNGPVVEVLLVEGSPARLIFRSRHASADGRGTLLLAEAVFAHLRGEEVAHCAAGPETDLELVQGLGRLPEPPPLRDQTALIGGAEDRTDEGARRTLAGDRELMCWHRVTLPVGLGNPLPSLLRCLADRAKKNIRLDLPVDLRRHREGLRSTANLTGLVRLQVEPQSTEVEIQRDIRERLREGQEADFVLAAEGLRGVPLWLMRWVALRGIQTSQRTGLFETSGTVSNIGRVDLGRFSCDEFRTEVCFFIPPGSPGLPLFATLVGGPGGIELCVSVPRWLLGGVELGPVIRGLAEDVTVMMGGGRQ